METLEMQVVSMSASGRRVLFLDFRGIKHLWRSPGERLFGYYSLYFDFFFLLFIYPCVCLFIHFLPCSLVVYFVS